MLEFTQIVWCRTGDGNSTTVAMETATTSTTESTESTTETHTKSQTTRSTDAPSTNGITDATNSIANAGQSNRQNGELDLEARCTKYIQSFIYY